MSKPPDDICICALATKAYPEFTDQQVIDLCQAHWQSVKECMRSSQVNLVIDAAQVHRSLLALKRRSGGSGLGLA